MWQRSVEAQERGRAEIGPEMWVVKAPRVEFGVQGLPHRIQRRRKRLDYPTRIPRGKN